MKHESHYDFLREHLPAFCTANDVNWDWHCGIIEAHGDKCYSYRDRWEAAGVHFYHGVMLYLLARCRPYSDECRDTARGWVDPGQWVIDNKDRFKLPPID